MYLTRMPISFWVPPMYLGKVLEVTIYILNETQHSVTIIQYYIHTNQQTLSGQTIIQQQVRQNS